MQFLIDQQVYQNFLMFSKKSEIAEVLQGVTVKGFEPATSYVRDQDATIAPARQDL